MNTQTETYDERSAREHTERIARITSDTAKLVSVAGLLGATVTKQTDMQDYPWDAYLTCKLASGEGLYMRTHITSKLHISAVWPQGEEGNYHTKVTPRDLRGPDYEHIDKGDYTIKVSIDKTPEQIAKDIQRRLMPDYKIAYAACSDVLQARTEYTDNKRAMVQAMAAMAKGEDCGESVHMSGRVGMSYGMIESFDPERHTVTLQLHGVSADKAQAILAILNA